eukprot:20848_1
MACTKWVFFMLASSISLTVFLAIIPTDTLNRNWYIDLRIIREDSQWNINIKNRNHLLFLHIPKTGGKVVEQLFLNEFNVSFPNTIPKKALLKKGYSACGASHHVPLNWLFERISTNSIGDQIYNWFFNIRDQMYNISPYYHSKLPYLRTDSFAVVRNPYSRFISQYQWCAAPNCRCTRQLIDWFSAHCQQYLPSDKALCKELHYVRNNANFQYNKTLIQKSNNSNWKQLFDTRQLLQKSKKKNAIWKQLRGEHGSTMHKKSIFIWKQFDFCDVKIFNKFAHAILTWLMDTAYASNDKHKRGIFSCHYVKQSEYIYNYTDRNDKIVKYILRTEHLTDDLIHLGEVYNISIDDRMVEKYQNQWVWPKNCNN